MRMKSRFLARGLVVAFAAMFALTGCEGDTGPAGPDGPQGPGGPQGPTGEPGPIHYAALASDGAVASVALAMFTLGGFTEGSTYTSFNPNSALPVLADLAGIDVVVAWTNNAPADPAGIGDLLADFVDAGGRVVLAQGAFSGGFAFTGRIMTSGYSPYSAAAGAGDTNARTFDTASFGMTPHPILTGINPFSWSVTGFSAVSDPALLGAPMEIAAFSNGHNAIALNPAGTVMGLNLLPQATEDTGLRLVTNAVLYLAGEL